MSNNKKNERIENLEEMFKNIPDHINIPEEYAGREINDVYHNYEFIKIDYTLDIDIPLNKNTLENAIRLTLSSDELDDKLEEISKADIKSPFSYQIIPPIKYLKSENTWKEYFERPIGDFFWLVVQKITKCDNFDAYITQLKIEQEKEVRDYFYSIGWNFELSYDEKYEILDFKFYEIMPEYVIE